MSPEAHQIELSMAEKNRVPVNGFGRCVMTFAPLLKLSKT